MDIGAAISALTIGLTLAGYAYRAELTALDFWLLGKLRAMPARLRKLLKPYRYKPRHTPEAVELRRRMAYQGRHFFDESKAYSTYSVFGERVVRQPVHA